MHLTVTLWKYTACALMGRKCAKRIFAIRSFAKVVPLPKIDKNRKRVVKGKTCTISTATPNRLLLLNERKKKNETDKINPLGRKKDRNSSINRNVSVSTNNSSRSSRFEHDTGCVGREGLYQTRLLISADFYTMPFGLLPRV